jgi:hypothetical protein
MIEYILNHAHERVLVSIISKTSVDLTLLQKLNYDIQNN